VGGLATGWRTGERARRAGPPGQPAAGARRGMGTGTGIFLITAGAILRFALGRVSRTG
jgi:hypothetical protein